MDFFEKKCANIFLDQMDHRESESDVYRIFESEDHSKSLNGLLKSEDHLLMDFFVENCANTYSVNMHITEPKFVVILFFKKLDFDKLIIIHKLHTASGRP